jgi:phosphatidate cytidylyltransferase
VISALVLAAVALSLTVLGGVAFRILVALGAALIFTEWARMSGHSADLRRVAVGAMSLAVVLVALLAGAAPVVVFALLAAGLVATLLDAQLRSDSRSLTLGLVYTGLAAISLAFLRDADEPGLWTILFLFAVVWATDILAYFVGRAVGGPKLAPAISPGKTWSGAIGGLVGGIAAGIAVAAVFGEIGLPIVLVGAVLSVVSQLGDLFESGVKRRYGVKDASGLIPGHGGMMDRVDGLVAAGFVLYLIGAIISGFEQPAHGLFNI